MYCTSVYFVTSFTSLGGCGNAPHNPNPNPNRSIFIEWFFDRNDNIKARDIASSLSCLSRKNVSHVDPCVSCPHRPQSQFSVLRATTLLPQPLANDRKLPRRVQDGNSVGQLGVRGA